MLYEIPTDPSQDDSEYVLFGVELLMGMDIMNGRVGYCSIVIQKVPKKVCWFHFYHGRTEAEAGRSQVS